MSLVASSKFVATRWLKSSCVDWRKSLIYIIRITQYSQWLLRIKLVTWLMLPFEIMINLLKNLLIRWTRLTNNFGKKKSLINFLQMNWIVNLELPLWMMWFDFWYWFCVRKFIRSTFWLKFNFVKLFSVAELCKNFQCSLTPMLSTVFGRKRPLPNKFQGLK